MVAPLLQVLVRLHIDRIVHRDIKPENLFLTRKRQLKLGDLGLAIVAAEELPFTRSGTLDYMAPEVNAHFAGRLSNCSDPLKQIHAAVPHAKTASWPRAMLSPCSPCFVLFSLTAAHWRQVCTLCAPRRCWPTPALSCRRRRG